MLDTAQITEAGGEGRGDDLVVEFEVVVGNGNDRQVDTFIGWLQLLVLNDGGCSGINRVLAFLDGVVG